MWSYVIVSIDVSVFSNGLYLIAVFVLLFSTCRGRLPQYKPVPQLSPRYRCDTGNALLSARTEGTVMLMKGFISCQHSFLSKISSSGMCQSVVWQTITNLLDELAASIFRVQE
jgi:hypothetical protein